MLKQQSFTHLRWFIFISTTLMGFNVVIVDGVDSFCSFPMCSDLTFFVGLLSTGALNNLYSWQNS